MNPVPVTDPGDERLVGYTALADRRRRDRLERELGVFTVEGHLALGQLVASPYAVVSVLVADDRWARVQPVVEGLDAPCYVAPPSVVAEAAGFDAHRGVLALGRRRPDPDATALLAGLAPASPVIVTEGVNDHENLGALFRGAAALGAGAVLGDPTTCDPLYRRSIRVSLGHVLAVPWTRLSPWPEALATVRASGRTVVALTPDADAVPIGRVATAGLGPVALLVGAEGPGLSGAALDAAEVRVRIPLAAGVDSLNVATAAAIALHRLAPLS